MQTLDRQPVTTLSVFFSLIALAFILAATGTIDWPTALVLGGAFVISAFIISFRFDKDLARQRREAERRIQARERERATLFASLRSKIVQGFPSPLMMIDADRRVVEANRHARDLFGESIVGNDISFYLRQPTALEIVRTAIASGQPEQREIELKSPVERYYTLFANRIDQHDQDGDVSDTSPFFVVIALQDITKSKVSDRMRVDFIANASHELRTPLSTIIGFVETLNGPAADDKDAQKRFLNIMALEADRMIRVIDDLLSLSRIELGKHVPPRDVVDLQSVASNISQSLQVALHDGGRKLDLEIAPNLPPILGDRDQIIQIFQNLITNSIKYSRSGSTIQLRMETAPNDQLRLQVIDQGDGISPEHLPRLTERFYRVDTARSRQIGGTGLGLAIVKHIVERHGGEMQIESIVGTGTTISILLPVHKNAAANGSAIAAETENA